ncbi:hypothetical protein F4778DRAFT_789578 [Xylariomycetidae sp. FL2044]|nr:hypothetical protein F4778DRAFT_789578 [Xylariomycetidae sp. FL2044]
MEQNCKYPGLVTVRLPARAQYELEVSHNVQASTKRKRGEEAPSQEKVPTKLPKQSRDVPSHHQVVDHTEYHDLPLKLGNKFEECELLRSELVKVRAEMEQLREIKERECNTLRTRLDKAVDEIDTMMVERSGFIAQDENVRQMWCFLVNRVKHFAFHFFDGPFKAPPDLAKGVTTILNCLSDTRISLFLGSWRHAPLVFQSLIWRFLFKIFENPFTIYGKEWGHIQQDIEVTPEHSIDQRKRYHLWRASGGQLLNDLRGVHEQRFKLHRQKLRELILPFVPELDRESAGKALDAYVNQAYRICQVFNQSNACYKAMRKHPGVIQDVGHAFDEEWMEWTEDNVSHFDGVDLLVSPALVKYGNSDAENYDTRVVLMKARVCYGRAP